jgi:hypothetical protein
MVTVKLEYEGNSLWWATVTTELKWMYSFLGTYVDAYFWVKYADQIDHTFAYEMFEDSGMNIHVAARKDRR